MSGVLMLTSPVDMHVHFRQGEMLSNVVPYHHPFEYALAMPNTEPPILNAKDVEQYRESVLAHCPPGLNPLFTVKLTPTTTPGQIKELPDYCVAGKLYPDGVTTNSENGFTAPMLLKLDHNFIRILEAMEQKDLVLCLHGEMPGEFCMDRELKFLEVVRQIAAKFPNLRIVLEHITTKIAVDVVRFFTKNVAATITLHHLLTNLDDVVGDKLNPHLFCKPIPKTPEDQYTLQVVALSGDPKFFFGSDSAPHTIDRKERCGCAGVFTAPVLLPALVEFFESAGNLDNLPKFVCHNARKWYRLPEAKSMVTLQRTPWKVPEVLPGELHPFLAGTTLNWSIIKP